MQRYSSLINRFSGIASTRLKFVIAGTLVTEPETAKSEMIKEDQLISFEPHHREILCTHRGASKHLDKKCAFIWHEYRHITQRNKVDRVNSPFPEDYHLLP